MSKESQGWQGSPNRELAGRNQKEQSGAHTEGTAHTQLHPLVNTKSEGSGGNENGNEQFSTEKRKGGPARTLSDEERAKRQLERRRCYYQKNKEKIAEYRRRWYQENKERKKEYLKRYRQINKEKLKEANKRYRQENKEQESRYKQENKEKIRERMIRWRQENKEKIRERNRYRLEREIQRELELTNRMWREALEAIQIFSYPKKGKDRPT